MYGYNGKILFIDLTASVYSERQMDENWWRIYGGGGALGAYFLLRDTPKGIDPFDERNLLIYASSVIAGQPGPGLAKFSVITKSPLSGGIAESRCEGPWGSFLKGSGYDGLIISGKAEHPVYLLLENKKVQFLDARDLWGKDTRETTRTIEGKHGKNDSAAAVIGQAGENLVRFGSIITSYSIQVPRMGCGAVMGSKNLKAVVLKGKNLPDVYDRKAFDELSSRFASGMEKNELSMWQKNPPGFSASADLSDYETAYIGSNNYLGNLDVANSNYRRENYLPYYSGHIECPGCPNDCIKIIDPETGNSESAGIHQEVTGAFGPNIGNNNLELMLQANVLCNLYGIDPVSMGFTLSFAMECFEKGIISRDRTGGIDLKFGSEESVLKMIEMTAFRQGIGAILAEGSKRAAPRFSGKARDFALHVKGIEMVSFEPRTQTNLALGYAAAPIGPRYDICEHDWDFDTGSGWEHTLEFSRGLGILERIPMEYTGPEKVKNYKVLSDLWSACDTLNLCIFASAPTRVLSLEMIVRLIQAVTGWKTSSYEFIRWGIRRFHLMKLYNLREGIGPEQDTLPERFFKLPIQDGRLKGTVIDEERFQKMISLYYEMMGWDGNGIPTPAALYEADLSWSVPIAEDIRKEYDNA
ncbi:MAG: aldehyde ferredoxin oxidoreductase family protein [Spirochaetia bacterium]